MELMLLKSVKDLGEPGDVVKVKRGFARNFLLPRRLAAPVSADTVNQVDATKKRIASEVAARAVEAKIAAERLANTSVHVEANANEEGHLFGSVTAAMIAEAVRAEGFALDNHAVQLDEPIKELGIYDVAVKLHAEVVTTVKLYVVAPPPKE